MGTTSQELLDICEAILTSPDNPQEKVDDKKAISLTLSIPDKALISTLEKTAQGKKYQTKINKDGTTISIYSDEKSVDDTKDFLNSLAEVQSVDFKIEPISMTGWAVEPGAEGTKQ